MTSIRTNQEIKDAEGVMVAVLRSGWPKHAAHHEDWVQDGLLKFSRYEFPTAPPTNELPLVLKSTAATIIRRVAQVAVRNQHVLQAPQEQPGVEESAEEMVVAREHAEEKFAKAMPVQQVTSLTLVGNARRIDPAELTLASVEESLHDLVRVAGIAARRNDSDRLSAIATVLTALADSNMVCDAALERVARRQLGPHRGPESRATQATAFIGAVRGGSSWAILNRLRSCPTLVRATAIPPHGQSWSDDEQAEARVRIDKVILNDVNRKAAGGEENVVNLARAVLRELGASAEAVKNLAAHQAKARSRAKAKNRPG